LANEKFILNITRKSWRKSELGKPRRRWEEVELNN